tara:strand:+ start:1231 stop:2022 length:792 start_codon:yes stop_codon:yes gene_type:complete
LKPKKKKRKKSKKSQPPKPRRAVDVARNPQPYQFPIYTPPFPSVINHQPKANANSQNVANTFRNIQAINTKELERLRGDLTAYRQESQTIFKKLVAFPRDNIYYDNETVSDLTDDEEAEIEDAKERLIDEEEENIVKGVLEQKEQEDKEAVGDVLSEMVSNVELQSEQEGMGAEDVDVGIDEESVGEETIMAFAEKAQPLEMERASATSSRKQRKTLKKSKQMLKDEIEAKTGNLLMSGGDFARTKLKEIQQIAIEEGIDINL